MVIRIHFVNSCTPYKTRCIINGRFFHWFCVPLLRFQQYAEIRKVFCFLARYCNRQYDVQSHIGKYQWVNQPVWVCRRYICPFLGNAPLCVLKGEVACWVSSSTLPSPYVYPSPLLRNSNSFHVWRNCWFIIIITFIIIIVVVITYICWNCGYIVAWHMYMFFVKQLVFELITGVTLIAV